MFGSIQLKYLSVTFCLLPHLLFIKQHEVGAKREVCRWFPRGSPQSTCPRSLQKKLKFYGKIRQCARNFNDFYWTKVRMRIRNERENLNYMQLPTYVAPFSQLRFGTGSIQVNNTCKTEPRAPWQAKKRVKRR